MYGWFCALYSGGGCAVSGITWSWILDEIGVGFRMVVCVGKWVLYSCAHVCQLVEAGLVTMQ